MDPIKKKRKFEIFEQKDPACKKSTEDNQYSLKHLNKKKLVIHDSEESKTFFLKEICDRCQKFITHTVSDIKRITDRILVVPDKFLMNALLEELEINFHIFRIRDNHPENELNDELNNLNKYLPTIIKVDSRSLSLRTLEVIRLKGAFILSSIKQCSLKLLSLRQCVSSFKDNENKMDEAKLVGYMHYSLHTGLKIPYYEDEALNACLHKSLIALVEAGSITTRLQTDCIEDHFNNKELEGKEQIYLDLLFYNIINWTGRQIRIDNEYVRNMILKYLKNDILSAKEEFINNANTLFSVENFGDNNIENIKKLSKNCVRSLEKYLYYWLKKKVNVTKDTLKAEIYHLFRLTPNGVDTEVSHDLIFENKHFQFLVETKIIRNNSNHDNIVCGFIEMLKKYEASSMKKEMEIMLVCDATLNKENKNIHTAHRVSLKREQCNLQRKVVYFETNNIDNEKRSIITQVYK